MSSSMPSKLRPSRTAIALLRALCSEIGGKNRTLARRTLSAARKARLAISDPAILWTLDGTDLILPLSHDLPLHRARYPKYSRNLGGLAAAVASDDPTATMVDIGANVGDSVAIVRARTALPILCIEGDDVFLPYLRHNVAGTDDIEIDPNYVAIHTDSTIAAVKRSGGTARLVEEDGGAIAAVRSLASILADHPRFERPRIIKVDTDGHDANILTAAASLVGEVRPVLFLEHDPALATAVHADDPVALFAVLAELGYEYFTSFSNVGELVATDRASELRTFGDRSRRLGMPGQPAYLDVVALHRDDVRLLAAVEAL